MADNSKNHCDPLGEADLWNALGHANHGSNATPPGAFSDQVVRAARLASDGKKSRGAFPFGQPWATSLLALSCAGIVGAFFLATHSFEKPALSDSSSSLSVDDLIDDWLDMESLVMDVSDTTMFLE